MRTLRIVLSYAFIVVASGTGAMASDGFVSVGDGIQLAQTQTKQNRDNRQDTRQDCRNAEGAVGADKRNCKQDGQQDNSQDGTKSGG
jgi:hypothetical protein